VLVANNLDIMDEVLDQVIVEAARSGDLLEETGQVPLRILGVVVNHDPVVVPTGTP
jgi:hypothetical protein